MREDGWRSRQPELGAGSAFLILRDLVVGALGSGFVAPFAVELAQCTDWDGSKRGFGPQWRPDVLLPASTSLDGGSLLARFEGLACVRKKIRILKFLSLLCSTRCAFCSLGLFWMPAPTACLAVWRFAEVEGQSS